MNLLGHIQRKICEHAQRFSELPTVTVPSAAVTDDDTDFWGDMRYIGALIDEILVHRRLRPCDALDGHQDSEMRGMKAVAARDETLLDWNDRAAQMLADWRAELDGVAA